MSHVTWVHYSNCNNNNIPIKMTDKQRSNYRRHGHFGPPFFHVSKPFVEWSITQWAPLWFNEMYISGHVIWSLATILNMTQTRNKTRFRGNFYQLQHNQIYVNLVVISIENMSYRYLGHDLSLSLSGSLWISLPWISFQGRNYRIWRDTPTHIWE